jgi:hypothetical protein
MTIRVQSADGVVHEFPAGTPDTAIDRAMKTYAMEQGLSARAAGGQGAGAPVAGGNDRRSVLASVDAAVRGAADTATFGLADEFAAGMGALTGIGGTFGDYSGNLDRQRRTDATDAEVNPVMRGAGQVAGAIPMALGTASIGAGANLGGRMAAATGLGAGTGAAYGFGSGEGIEDRLSDAGYGALTGAALGAGLQGAGEVLAPVAGAIGRQIPGLLGTRAKPLPGYDPKAFATVSERLAADIAGGQDVRGLAQALGPEAMLLDVGDNVSGLAGALANAPGAALPMVKKALSGRQGKANERLTMALDEAFGTSPGMVAEKAAARAAQRANATPLYQQAESVSVPMTPELRGILGRINEATPGVIGRTRRIIAASEGRQFNPAGLFDEATVAVELRPLDDLKKGLDGLIESARRSDPQRARALTILKNDLVSELDAAAPTYADARAAWAGPQKIMEAAEYGRGLLARNVERDQVAADLKALSAPERAAVLRGLRNTLGERLDGSTRSLDQIAEGQDSTRGIMTALSPQTATDKAAMLIGDEKAGILGSKLSAEARFAMSYADAVRNSKTAGRNAFRDLLSRPMADGEVASTSLPGLLALGARKAVRAARGAAANARDTKRSQDIANLLISKPTPDLIETLAKYAAVEEKKGASSEAAKKLARSLAAASITPMIYLQSNASQ